MVQSFLDVGAGSGILAIAAAKLGYGPLEAIELDRVAIQIARANAHRNGVAGKIRFQRADFTTFSRRTERPYSLICANLVANLLITCRDHLIARLAPEGALVLAGILKTEFAIIRRTYEAAGLRLDASAADDEWRSGAFIRSAGVAKIL